MGYDQCGFRCGFCPEFLGCCGFENKLKRTAKSVPDIAFFLDGSVKTALELFCFADLSCAYAPFIGEV